MKTGSSGFECKLVNVVPPGRWVKAPKYINTRYEAAFWYMDKLRGDKQLSLPVRANLRIHVRGGDPAEYKAAVSKFELYVCLDLEPTK